MTSAATTLQPRAVCILPAMPFEIHFRGGQKLKPELEHTEDGPVFHLHAKTEAEFMADTFQDWELLSRTMIDAFLAVSSPEEALQFLASTGHFLWDAWSWQDARHSDLLSWTDFQQWQDLIRDIDQNGFLIATKEETAPGGISTIDDFPAERLDENRKRLILNIPDSTFDLLNGCLPTFDLVSRPNLANLEGPSERALAIETMTSIDTMLARMSVEQLLQSR